MLIPLLRRAERFLTTLRYEQAQADALLRHITETEIQADIREQASAGRDEQVPRLRAMAAALRQRAGLPTPEPQGPQGIGGAPLTPAARPAPAAPQPPFPLEETWKEGLRLVHAAILTWEEVAPDLRLDLRDLIRESAAKVVPGAELRDLDEGLNRLAHLQAQDLPADLRVAEPFAQGVEKLVAVRGEIKRRQKAAAP